MKVANHRLQVHLDFGLGAPPLLLGECLWYASKKVAAFEWSQQAMEVGFKLSPLHMPLRKGLFLAEPTPFGGLHGLLSDSIPDGFGLRLMNKSLVTAGHSLASITPVQRLAWVGTRGLGALTYTPALYAEEPRALIDIADLGVHAAKADVENFTDIPEAAIKAGGSAHGARPKFWAAVHKDGQKIILGDSPEIPTDFSACLVKFAPAKGDRNEPFYEAACLALANKYGVDAATARVLHHPTGVALAVDRFDRIAGGARKVVQSLAALLNDDFRFSKLDYFHLFQVSKALSDAPESERIYRQACFNVALSMRDDHSKNFAFCMDQQGQWKLSPAFDLCPNEGPSGWQTMTVSDVGDHIDRSCLLKFAQKMGLPPAIANDGIDRALSAASEFEALALSLGSQKAGANKWARRFKAIGKGLGGCQNFCV
jgi:serine/threonine-protein kinase HipA